MEKATFLLKNRQNEVGRLLEGQVTNSNNKSKMFKTLMTVLYLKQSSEIFNYDTTHSVLEQI